MRKRIDAYYKLVVRNLRDLIPKQVFNFLLIKCIRELEFEAFQFTSDVDKLKEWLNEVIYEIFSPPKCVSGGLSVSRPSRCSKSRKKESEWIPISPNSSGPAKNSHNT